MSNYSNWICLAELFIPEARKGVTQRKIDAFKALRKLTSLSLRPTSSRDPAPPTPGGTRPCYLHSFPARGHQPGQRGAEDRRDRPSRLQGPGAMVWGCGLLPRPPREAPTPGGVGGAAQLWGVPLAIRQRTQSPRDVPRGTPAPPPHPPQQRVWSPPTRMSRQAAFSRVIWSAMVRPVKPGRRLANSTILIMHLVASSLNLSQRPRSNRTRWSALEFYRERKCGQS